MADTPKTPRIRYIKEMPSGFQVVIPRFHFTKMVASSGRTREETLQLAIQARDSYLKERGQLSLLGSIPHVRPTGRNNPLAGVTLAVNERGIGQAPAAYFRVTYKNAEGKYKAKIFGLVTHGGYRKAFDAAIKFRISVCNLLVEPSEVPLLRPSLNQFVKIMNLVGDVPLPVRSAA